MDDIVWSDQGDGAVGKAPDQLSCSVCGSVPAAEAPLRRQVGLLITRRVESVDAPLCRDCGTALFRSMTNRTLITGWWGLVSFFTNFGHIWRNVRSSRVLARLDAPRPGAGSAAAPMPMDVGRPLTRRSGTLLVGVFVVLVTIGGVSEALNTARRDDSGGISRSGMLEVTDLRVGDCFDDPKGIGPDGVEVHEIQARRCDEPHDNEVIHTGSLTGDDFPGADKVFELAALECLSPFARHVGISYEVSALEIAAVTPTTESWKAGDREYVCVAYDPAGKVTGSLSGARR